MNSSTHATTAQIPFTVVFGIAPSLPLDHAIRSLQDNKAKSSSDVVAQHARVNEDAPEFEVEDNLSHRILGHGRSSRTEFLVKWLGYPRHEATWEPEAQLTNAPEVLSQYQASVGLS